MFLAGELSYSKVRAICRVVEPVNETDLIALARQITASQLDRVVGKMPRPDDPVSEAESSDNAEFRNNGDGTMTLLITRPIAEMTAAKKALQAKARQVIDRQQGEGETKPTSSIASAE